MNCVLLPNQLRELLLNCVCLKFLPHCDITYCEKWVVIGMIKIWFVIFKIQVRFFINYNLKGFYHLICLHIISLLSVLHFLIILSEKTYRIN